MVNTWVLVHLLGWVLGAGPNDAAFLTPPYVQRIGPHEATLMWVSGSAQPAEVQVYGSGEPERRMSIPGPRRPVTARDPWSVFAARIDALSAGREYGYKITQAGLAQTGHFRTQGPPGAPITLVIYGDNRADPLSYSRLVDEMRADSPDLAINTGDLVSHGGRPDQWLEFLRVSAPLISIAPLYPVTGNHDLRGEGLSTFRQLFDLPRDGTFYAFTWGNLRLIAIDTNVHAQGRLPNPRQTAWLEQQVALAQASATIDHVVAFVHQGPFSSNPNRRSISALASLFARLHSAGLDLLVSGHDHYYERGIASFGLPYMVVGSGGAPLYATRGSGSYEGYRAVVSESVRAYVRLRFVGTHADGCAIDISGTAFDCFELGSAATNAR